MRYPGYPDLEEAYLAYRGLYDLYLAKQEKRWKKVTEMDLNGIQTAWNHYLKLRNKYLGNNY